MKTEKDKKQIQYWLRLLESQGFDRVANLGEDYGQWFYKDGFHVKINKWSSGELNSFSFHFNNILTNAEFNEESIDDIEAVIKGIADFALLSLCVNVKWFQCIISELFTQEKVVG